MISIIINEVRFTGHLTETPKLRALDGGKLVVNFSLGQTRRYKVEGETREEKNFIDFEVWGPKAEALAKHAVKGSGLYIAGRMKQNSWQDKETQEGRSRMIVVVEEWQFAEPRKDDKEAKAIANDLLGQG